jgi:hypothetical protein
MSGVVAVDAGMYGAYVEPGVVNKLVAAARHGLPAVSGATVPVTVGCAGML